MELSLVRSKLYKKLMLIYLMNVVDWVCTLSLLRTGRFYEANPLMQSYIGNLPLGFILKCLFPAAAIGTVICALRMLDRRDLRIADCFISFVLVLYLTVDLDHIANYLVLFFQNSP